jgi:hypothetical protein
VEWIAALPQEPAHGASSSNGADPADTLVQSRYQGDVTLSRPVTDLGGFEWKRMGKGDSRGGKRWTARVGVSLDGNGSLTARLLEDVTSAPREGGHV